MNTIQPISRNPMEITLTHPSSKADDASVLYEAAMAGDTSTLHGLISRDTLILKRSRLSSFSETPLHISVLAGHVNFTREILHQDPEMAMEVDSTNSTPLHLAAVAPGPDTEIVRILLGVGEDACLVRDEDGQIPLHLAVIRGRVGIVHQLVLARRESVLENLDGDTVLHLCVKYNHLEVLKVLVDMINGDKLLSSIMWLGDQDGNTVLHLAVMFKHVQTTSYLATLPNMGGASALNLLNGHGSTPLDCLELYPKDCKSQRIRNLLVEAAGGAIPRSRSQDRPKPSYLVPFPASKEEAPPPPTKSKKNKSCCKSMGRKIKSCLAYDNSWLEKKKDTVLLVATIIASMSFQAATNPPGGVWSENRTSPEFGRLCNSTTSICKAGTAMVAYGDNPHLLEWFVSCNTVAFGASLGIILLTVGGFPIKKNKFMAWILTQAICMALTCMTLAFVFAGMLVIPYEHDTTLFAIVYWVLFLFVWILLIMVISLLDSLRFVIWVYSRLRRIGRAVGCSCCSRGKELV